MAKLVMGSGRGGAHARHAKGKATPGMTPVHGKKGSRKGRALPAKMKGGRNIVAIPSTR